MAPNRKSKARSKVIPASPAADPIDQSWAQQYRKILRTSEFALVTGLVVAGFLAADMIFSAVLMAIAWVVVVFFLCFNFKVSRKTAWSWSAVAFMLIFALWTLADFRHQPDKDIATLDTEISTERSARLQSEQQASTQAKLEENPAQILPGTGLYNGSGCPGSDELNFYLGNNSFGAGTFPFVAITVNNQPFLTVDRGKDNALYATFDLKDKDGNLLARVVRNVGLVLPMHAFLLPRTSEHDLSVLNEKGDKVLDIDYVNKNALRITGEFDFGPNHLSISDSAIMTNDKVFRSGNRLCDVGAGFAIQF